MCNPLGIDAGRNQPVSIMAKPIESGAAGFHSRAGRHRLSRDASLLEERKKKRTPVARLLQSDTWAVPAILVMGTSCSTGTAWFRGSQVLPLTDRGQDTHLSNQAFTGGKEGPGSRVMPERESASRVNPGTGGQAQAR